MVRLLAVAAGVVLVVGGLAALLLAFTARDDAPVSQTEGPGVLQPDKGVRHLSPDEHVPLAGLTDPPTSGAHHARLVTRDRRTLSPDEILHAIELGNVIVFYESRRPPAALRSCRRT